MAKDAKADATMMEGDVAAPPRKNKKLIIVIVSALFLVVCAAGAALFLLKGHADDEGDDEGGEKTKLVKKGKESAPVYVALETFTVNLVPENGEQFLQLMISVEVADAQVGDRMKMYTPKIRNNVMLLLSGKKASELISKEGKQTLANEIRDLINDVLHGGGKKTDDAPAREVLFTSFIIQ
jgi:flagellar FliL protein